MYAKPQSILLIIFLMAKFCNSLFGIGCLSERFNLILLFCRYIFNLTGNGTLAFGAEWFWLIVLLIRTLKA